VLLSTYIKTTEGALSCVEHSDVSVCFLFFLYSFIAKAKKYIKFKQGNDYNIDCIVLDRPSYDQSPTLSSIRKNMSLTFIM
jgi:hypothetical protein